MTAASTTDEERGAVSPEGRQAAGCFRSALHTIAAGMWLLFIFALACLSVGGAYRFVGPPRVVPALTPKLNHLEQNRGKYDLLIFGSSRIFRGFVSPEFDRLMSEGGRPTHSFNVGIDGMSPPESFYTIRQVIARGARPKWMLIELWDLRTVAEFRYAEIMRYVHWHDLQHTWLVIERVFRDDQLALGEKLRRTAAHLYLALVQNTHRGQGADWLHPVLDRPRPGKTYVEPTPWVATGGFSPDNSKPFTGSKREEFETAVQKGMTAYRTLPLPPSIRRAAADLVRDVRAAGIEPVFVIMPTVHRGESYIDVRSQGVDASLITFTDMRRYPDLYRTDLHRDDVHMTEVGARVLTAHVAEEFLKIFGPQPAAPNPP